MTRRYDAYINTRADRRVYVITTGARLHIVQPPTTIIITAKWYVCTSVLSEDYVTGNLPSSFTPYTIITTK